MDGLSLLVAVASALLASSLAQPSPHIVVILADDLGWNDVGFHGSDQIPTPNIDALAYNGVILNSHYTPALCTPSRSAFMTGKYPIHTGMQHLVILEAEPWGLPLQEKLLPEHLRASGYRTHAIGKWHLGFHRQEYTPTFRGFDSHYGYYQGFQDYYDHYVKATFLPYDGYDMRRNLTVDWDAQGRYSTDIFTEEAVRVVRQHDPREPLFLYLSHLAPHAGTGKEPFQAPDEEVAKFAHIADPERRVYAAMVSRLDQSVGEVVSALRDRGMLGNSIILFMSDNGAPTHGIHSNRGSNYPLRGIKETPFEGGVRSVAAIWSPLIQRRQRVSSQLMHMTDWLPTLYSAAGHNVTDLGEIDGLNMWETIVSDAPTPRTEFVHNIDDLGEAYAALRKGDWKYIKGSVHKGIADKWFGETGRGTDNPRYDVEAVMGSPTSVALAGFTTRQQIRQKNQPHNSTDTAWLLLSSKTVMALRQQAQVKCPAGPEVECRPRDAPCVFNIKDDPCERNNLADARPDVLADLEEMLARYRQTMVPPNNKPSDPLANPSLWNHTWVSWQDDPQLEIHFELMSRRQLMKEALTAATILMAVVILVVLMLRLGSPSAFIFKLPSDKKHKSEQLASPQEQAEKVNLTFPQSY